MNFKPLLFVCISLLLSIHVNAQNSEQLKIDIDKILSEIPGNEPGIILGVTMGDESMYARGKGSELLGKTDPLTPKTPFFLSSISKEFIGVIITQLIAEGKVNLHSPIREYIPEFPTYELDPTIYQALHHTSGIKDYSNLLYFCGELFNGFLPIDNIIELLSRQKSLNFTPGTEYLYSNSNYELLAEVITRTTGEDFREHIQAKIFEPLGMKNTYFASSKGTNVIGYKVDRNNELVPYPTEDSPPLSVMQIVSTVNDMILWDQFLTQKLFKQDEVGNLILTKGKLDNGREIDYSMGFEQYSYQDQEIIGHGGYSRGFQSNHVHFKKLGFSIIVFSNSLKYNTNSYTYQVADIILQNRGIETSQEEIAPPPDLFISKKDSKPYLGSYYNPDKKIERVIYREQGIMRYNRPDQYESRLVALGEHKFQMLNAKNQLTSTVSFELKEEEAIILKYHYPNSQEVVEHYRFKYHSYKTRELAQFEGTYHSEELDCQFEIKVIDSKLELFREGSKVSSLKVFKENSFRDNRLGGIFEFENDGTVTAFWLSQERARNVYFKKQ